MGVVLEKIDRTTNREDGTTVTTPWIIVLDLPFSRDGMWACGIARQVRE
jgi:hypothetical protein